MKKLFLISVVLFPFCLAAQPTLDAASVCPVNGDQFTQHHVAYTSAGSAGANVTWDFSMLSSIADINYNFMLPTATPYSSTFPGSTLAAYSSQGSYQYLITGSSALSMNGLYVVSSSSYIAFTEEEDLLRFPFTYNDSYSDSMAATTPSVTRHGHADVVADGYGTLIMPYGTVNNVLRVKITETYQDYISGNPVYSYNSTNYYWYKPGIRWNILQFSQLYANGSLYQQYGLYLDGSELGIEGETAGSGRFRAFPNPATDHLIIQDSDNSSEPVLIRLYSMTGQQVWSENVVLNNNYRLDLTGITAGLYTLTLQNNGVNGTMQIMVNR